MNDSFTHTLFCLVVIQFSKPSITLLGKKRLHEKKSIEKTHTHSIYSLFCRYEFNTTLDKRKYKSSRNEVLRKHSTEQMKTLIWGLHKFKTKGTARRV